MTPGAQKGIKLKIGTYTNSSTSMSKITIPRRKNNGNHTPAPTRWWIENTREVLFIIFLFYNDTINTLNPNCPRGSKLASVAHLDSITRVMNGKTWYILSVYSLMFSFQWLHDQSKRPVHVQHFFDSKIMRRNMSSPNRWNQVYSLPLVAFLRYRLHILLL